MVTRLILLLSSVYAYVRIGAQLEIKGEEIETFKTEFINSIRVIYIYSSSSFTPKPLTMVYSKAAKYSKEKNLPIVFGKIDSSNQVNHPFITNIRNSEIVFLLPGSLILRTYTGPQTIEGIPEFLLSQKGSVEVYNSIAEVKHALYFKYELEGMVLGIFKDSDAESMSFFLDFSSKNPTIYQYGILIYNDDNKEEIHKEIGYSGPAVVACRAPRLVNSFGAYYASLELEKISELEGWLVDVFFTQIGYLTKDRENVLLPKIPRLILYLDTSNTRQLISFINGIEKEFRNEFTLRRCDRRLNLLIADKNEYSNELQELGVYHLPFVYVAQEEIIQYVIHKDVHENYLFNPVALKTLKDYQLHRNYPGFNKNEVEKPENIQVPSKVVWVRTVDFDRKIKNNPKNQIVHVYTENKNFKNLHIISLNIDTEIVFVSKSKYLPKEFINEHERNYLLYVKASDKLNPILYEGEISEESIKEFLNKNQ